MKSKMGHGMKGERDNMMNNMRKDSEKNTHTIETPKGEDPKEAKK